MPRIPPALLLLLCVSAGCTCGAFDKDTTRFACMTDADCGSAFNCVDVTGGKECIASCATTQVCPAGRECKTGVCADVDECAMSGRCGAEALCVNTPGSWECRCSQGFSGTPTVGRPATCVDVDECRGQDCGTLGVCTNTTGSFECSCPPGAFGGTVVGGPTSCSTVNRCTAAGQCGANATCVSTATSFTCTCAQGYSGATTTGAAASCTDADECVTPAVCGANASCTNTQGSFSCACQLGFAGTTTTGMAATCSDVDECPTASCGANAQCTNTPGTFICSCDPNFFGPLVTGGPTVCSMTDRCSGVNCGANAACTSGVADYTCTCNAGFAGASTMGAPASCSDRNECASPGACGANAVCTNSVGSYACACMTGFNGSPTVGMPATCTAGVVVLGTAVVTGGSVPFVLSRSVAASERLVLVVISSINTLSLVSDTRGNTWVRLVNNSSCGTCGNAELWTSRLTTALQSGDTVSAFVNSSSALWLGHVGAYVSIDATGTYNGNNTPIPFITTSTAVIEPDELLIGALVTRSFTTLNLDGGGFVEELSLDGGQLSGVIGTRIATGLSGQQTFAARANPAQRFSGVLATFYNVPPALPTALSLTHTPNNRAFAVSWTGGRGNGGSGGCSVQVQLASGMWTSVATTLNCDADTVGRAVNLPFATNWYGTNWTTVPVRLVRSSDGVVLGTFPSNLTCAVRPASSTATPTIDEDCDGSWDDHICNTYTWVSGMVFATTFTACTNATDTTATKPCSVTNELENRYTEGMSTAISPASVFSSNSYGTATACTGPFTGATQWTCTPSNCTYR